MYGEYRCYCTRMYPMPGVRLSPLSPLTYATLPHTTPSSRYPPVPNPILESQLLQSFSWLAMIPILASEWKTSKRLTSTVLNPSLLQFNCKEASEPIRLFHVSRPSEMARYWPSAISEYRESAFLSITVNLSCCPIFIPRQILEKDVFQ